MSTVLTLPDSKFEIWRRGQCSLRLPSLASQVGLGTVEGKDSGKPSACGPAHLFLRHTVFHFHDCFFRHFLSACLPVAHQFRALLKG